MPANPPSSYIAIGMGVAGALIPLTMKADVVELKGVSLTGVASDLPTVMGESSNLSFLTTFG